MFVVGCEGAGAFVEDFEGTEDVAAFAGEGHAQQGAGFEFQALIDAAVDFALFGGDVGIDAAELASMHNLADDAGVVRDAEFAAIDAEGRAADEGVCRFVPEENAGAFGFE